MIINKILILALRTSMLKKLDYNFTVLFNKFLSMYTTARGGLESSIYLINIYSLDIIVYI